MSRRHDTRENRRKPPALGRRVRAFPVSPPFHLPRHVSDAYTASVKPLASLSNSSSSSLPQRWTDRNSGGPGGIVVALATADRSREFGPEKNGAWRGPLPAGSHRQCCKVIGFSITTFADGRRGFQIHGRPDEAAEGVDAWVTKMR